MLSVRKEGGVLVSAASAAHCESEHGHEVLFPCTLAHALVSSRGAARYPSRKPVIAAPLENPLMTTVRSYMPSKEEKHATGSAP